MNYQTKIICPKCHNDTGLVAENYTNIVLIDDVRCPRCGCVLIMCSRVTC
jgi:hypothetical protein